MFNPKSQDGSTRKEAPSPNVSGLPRATTVTAFLRILSAIFYGISRWNHMVRRSYIITDNPNEILFT